MRDQFERIHVSQAGSLGLWLLLGAGGNALAQLAARNVSPLARVDEGDVGIGTDGEEHSLALDAVLHAPEFAAARRHKEESALPVSQFSGLVG
ncbi:MAG: hypothetical protein Q8R81_16325 [Novosphingobium sp.]|nr:hypothetical protein [Novosphingobium sp.]MDP3551946.1 hypothetical protein [Novosphingobium sp.]